MKAVIITGGRLPCDSLIEKELADTALIICADTGMGYAREKNILPHLIIGDMDSAHPDDVEYFISKNVETIKLDTDKAETDTQAAANQALVRGATEIIILGGTGDRLDHSLGNMQVLYGLMEERIPTRMEAENETVYVTNSRILFQNMKNQTLSIIPMGGGCVVGRLSGVQYPLENHYLKRGSTEGISNVILEDKAEIIVIHGRLSVVVSRIDR